MPERLDDPTVADHEVLWRRILPEWIHRSPDGTCRPASMAFLDGLTGEVSVHRAGLTTIERALQDHPNHSLASIQASLPRSLGLVVAADPTNEDPSHALICSYEPTSQRKRSAREMAKAASWVRLADS